MCKDHIANQREASNSVTDSLALSNPADAQNVSCLGLCRRDTCLIWAGYFQSSVVGKKNVLTLLLTT